jgi:hypothetical protein
MQKVIFLKFLNFENNDNLLYVCSLYNFKIIIFKFIFLLYKINFLIIRIKAIFIFIQFLYFL